MKSFFNQTFSINASKMRSSRNPIWACGVDARFSQLFWDKVCASPMSTLADMSSFESERVESAESLLSHLWYLSLLYVMYFCNTRFYSLLILLHFSCTIFKAALSENNHQTSKFLKLPHLHPLWGWGLSNPRPSLLAPDMRGWHSVLLVQSAEAWPEGLESPLPSREMGQINNN